MIAYSTTNEIVIMAIYKLNLKFTHELMQYVNEENYPEFLRCYDCLLSKKWREYEGMN